MQYTDYFHKTFPGTPEVGFEVPQWVWAEDTRVTPIINPDPEDNASAGTVYVFLVERVAVRGSIVLTYQQDMVERCEVVTVNGRPITLDLAPQDFHDWLDLSEGAEVGCTYRAHSPHARTELRYQVTPFEIGGSYAIADKQSANNFVGRTPGQYDATEYPTRDAAVAAAMKLNGES